MENSSNQNNIDYTVKDKLMVIKNDDEKFAITHIFIK